MADENNSVEGFVEKLKSAFVKLKTLTITTAVGPFDWDTSNKEYVPRPGASVKVMRTQLDLLEGDKITQMDDEFATGSLQALREYHQTTEQSAHQLLEANVAAVEKLFELAKKLKGTP